MLTWSNHATPWHQRHKQQAQADMHRRCAQHTACTQHAHSVRNPLDTAREPQLAQPLQVLSNGRQCPIAQLQAPRQVQQLQAGAA